MPEEPPLKSDGTPSSGAPVGEGEGENERPTINPPFDVAAYARALTAASPDLPTTRPPPPDTAVRPGQAPRSPSALWMADALVPSGLPPRDVPASAPALLEQPFAALPASSAPEPGEHAMDSDAPEIREQAPLDLAAEMRERASLGDYTGALEMAEILQSADPSNLEAAECIETCRAILEKMYSARLGPLDRVPVVIVPRAQMRWLSIDHRAGFVLSLIDGFSTVEMIIDVSGMGKLDALRILLELVQQRIVAFRT